MAPKKVPGVARHLHLCVEVISGTVWIATHYGWENRTALAATTPGPAIPISSTKVVFDHDDSKSNLALSVKAFPPGNIIYTGMGVLLAVRPTSLTLEFYMWKRTSEEATELSSTSLKLLMKVAIELLYILSIVTNEVSDDEQVYTTSLAKHPTSLRPYPNGYPAWTPDHTTPSSPQLEQGHALIRAITDDDGGNDDDHGHDGEMKATMSMRYRQGNDHRVTIAITTTRQHRDTDDDNHSSNDNGGDVGMMQRLQLRQQQ
ncbi:hypothetical protein EDB86DRAFT_2841076 [Lactarius hatsudake]|nr:hypothetical protein EDB86DRAFT_2841076 [Lactarius hatsudake]